MRDGLRPRTAPKESVEVEGKKNDEVVLKHVTNDIALKSNDCEEVAFGDGKNDDLSVPGDGFNANGEKADGKNEEGVEGGGKKDDEVVLNNVTNEIASKSIDCEEVVFGGSVNAIFSGDGKNSGLTVPINGFNANGEKIDGKESIEGEGKIDDEVVLYNVTKEIALESNNCEEVASSGSLNAIFTGDRRNYDISYPGDGFSSNNCNGRKVDGVGADNCDGEHTDHCKDKNGNGEQAYDVQTKSRRGRKRKNLQASSKRQRVEMIDGNKKPVSRRVLRSRIMTANANYLVGELSDMSEETDEGIDEVDKKKLKLENVDDISAAPAIKGKEEKKKNKSRRGRHPKVNADNTYMINVTNDKGLEIMVCLTIDTPLSKLKAESGVSEKKDIRKQVIDLIVRCGWKIHFVPRASRSYNDLVYINPEGKTHWSITKAYTNLKERIDSGEANFEEQAGFIVVPDETLRELFRITTERRSDCGIKRSKGVEKKEPGMNKASSKITDDSNCEEKSNTCKRFNGRKRKSVPLQRRKKRRCALLAREAWIRSMQDDDENEQFNKSRNLLSWMIDLGKVPEGAIVQYRDPIRGIPLLKGKVMHAGIFCDCCLEVQTISGFQLHGGMKLGEPLQNLYFDSGLSLFQCTVDSWSQHVKLRKIGFCSVDVSGADKNDDTCNICGNEGHLVCCDCCPSTFHLSCLGIENVPAGDWKCMYCTCKFCQSVGYEVLSQYDKRHLITCRLCEAKFHSTCINLTDAKSMNSATISLCSSGCQKIFNLLQKFVGLKQEMEGGLSWTILHRYDIGNDASLSDYPLKIQCNAKLAVAYSVMDECFSPVIDSRSQSEMISNVIYNCGSNFRRLNYSGFHTFILEKGDEVVSAASVRFHGRQLAEMPFIATRIIYRRQGLSRKLLTVIEKVLSSMDIQKLIIPAVSDVTVMWRDSFGFVPLEETTLQAIKTMSIIVFSGTNVLQKSLLPATDGQADDDSDEKRKGNM